MTFPAIRYIANIHPIINPHAALVAQINIILSGLATLFEEEYASNMPVMTPDIRIFDLYSPLYLLKSVLNIIIFFSLT